MSFERPKTWALPFANGEAQHLERELKAIEAKSILEFGPGDSTEYFANLGMQITTCEHDQHWYDVAQERFKDTPNVRVLKFENELPVPPIEGLGDLEKFDVGFVDAPQGYSTIKATGFRRKKFPGQEDCSRLNTCLAALGRCKVVFLHDIGRGLERATLGRLNAMGFDIEISGVFGKITWQPKQTSSTEPSEILVPSLRAWPRMPIHMQQ